MFKKVGQYFWASEELLMKEKLKESFSFENAISTTLGL